LQLIEVPTGKKQKKGKQDSDIYLYVKEGRVGDRRGVKERLDVQDSPKAAVRGFTKVFEQLTGNKFEPWEKEKIFEKRRNRYFPLDMVGSTYPCFACNVALRNWPGSYCLFLLVVLLCCP
jgi:hypothetical protein